MELIDELRRQTVKDLARDMERPNLVALSYALRHPETWPEDFVWNYSDCGMCAMGLACELWPQLTLPSSTLSTKSFLARTFAMSYKTAVKVFWEMHSALQTKLDNVMPDDVADAIDSYLKESA